MRDSTLRDKIGAAIFCAVLVALAWVATDAGLRVKGLTLQTEIAEHNAEQYKQQATKLVVETEALDTEILMLKARERALAAKPPKLVNKVYVIHCRAVRRPDNTYGDALVGPGMDEPRVVRSPLCRQVL